MAAKLISSLAILATVSIGFCQGDLFKPKLYFIDTPGSAIYRDEKVARLLEQSYETDEDRAQQVAKVLAYATNPKAKFGPFSIEQLLTLNRKGAQFCLVGELERRRAMCPQMSQWVNLKHYCEHLVEKLIDYCANLHHNELIEAALDDRWPDFHRMLTISEAIITHVLESGDGTKLEDENVVQFCQLGPLSVNRMRESCGRVYGWLEREVFPLVNAEFVVHYLHKTYTPRWSTNVAQALERCRIILKECEPEKGLLGWTCLDWLGRSKC